MELLKQLMLVQEIQVQIQHFLQLHQQLVVVEEVDFLEEVDVDNLVVLVEELLEELDLLLLLDQVTHLLQIQLKEVMEEVIVQLLLTTLLLVEVVLVLLVLVNQVVIVDLLADQEVQE